MDVEGFVKDWWEINLEGADGWSTWDVERCVESAVERDRKGRGHLGVQNDWKETPEIVRKCEEENHSPWHMLLDAGCLHMAFCPDCGYWYEYDSSG